MTAFPLVSIIITCYNYGNFIRDAFNSALQQTYSNIEIVIVDDGSDEVTCEVLKAIDAEYADVKVYYNNNKGPAAARNFGIEKSQGSYIVPLDADDVLDKHFVEKGMDVIRHDNNISPVYCDVRYFGNVCYTKARKEWSQQAIYCNNFILISSVFSRQAWQDCGGFDEYLIGLEDWEFWVHMAKKGYVGKRIPEPLLYVRKHDGLNLTHISTKEDTGRIKRKYIKLKHGLGNKYRWFRRLGIHYMYFPVLKDQLTKVD